jgi:hypothetical protein
MIKSAALRTAIALLFFGSLSSLALAETPVVTSVSPTSVTTGGSSFSLTVLGKYFNYSTVVTWGGLKRSTQVVNSGKLIATIGSADILTARTVQVGADKSGKLSNTLPFTVKSGTTTPTPIQITVNSLPSGSTGATYKSTLTASGGTSPYAWSLVSGQLPTGLTLASSTGVISGTPTTAGQFSFSVQAKDSASSPQAATSALGITIGTATTGPKVTTTSLPSANLSTAYNATLSGTGGATPYTWSLTSGQLPNGLSLSASTGAISGTPTTTGTFPFTVQLRDGNGSVASASLSIPVLSSTGSTKGIWISPNELAALPMSGTAWSNLKAKADSDCGAPNLADQENFNDTCVLAKALVYARTGTSSYRTYVRNQLAMAINTELGGRQLALGRNLVSYVIAADLIGLPSYDKTFDDQSFRPWLKRTKTELLDGITLVQCHEGKPQNWGTVCGASRAAVDIYLGDTTDLARTAKVFQGWLGDRSAYAGFSWSTTLSNGGATWSPLPSTALVPVNPKGATVNWNGKSYNVDGALIAEMSRGGSFQWTPLHTLYAWTGLGGAIVQAEILYRAGYPTYQWGDQAILRAYQYMWWLHNATGGYWYDVALTSGHDNWQPFIVNYRYGSSLPSHTPTTAGWNMGWTDWTHAKR